MKILKLNTLVVAFILFVPALFQVITGFGLFVNGFTVGIIPESLIYFFWLLLLSIEMNRTNKKKINGRIVRLLITIFFVLPLYWFLLDKMMADSHLMAALSPIGGLVLFWLLYVIIDSWNYLATSIFTTIEKDIQSGGQNSLSKRKIFWYFVGGLITIWWLQPLIIKATNKIDKNPWSY